jgi:TldD protein
VRISLGVFSALGITHPAPDRKNPFPPAPARPQETPPGAVLYNGARMSPPRLRPLFPSSSTSSSTSLLLSLLILACAGKTPAGRQPTATAGDGSGLPRPDTALRMERADPLSGGGAPRPAGLLALEEEVRRAMTELGKAAQPGKPAARASQPPYFISYEMFDRDETLVSASYGALVQSSARRTRVLDTDVRVGGYELDSTHPLRSDSFDFGGFAGERAVPLPLEDDTGAMRAVAWLDTDRRYKSAAEALLKIRTQRTLKAAEEDQSDDFSREQPVVYLGQPARLTVDRPTWEARMRALSARFRGHGAIHDSQVTLQVSTVNRWMVNSEGSLVQDGRSYVRVFLQADTRADDGMELERFESFDAASFAALASGPEMDRAADSMIADLEALRRAPLADPYIGPAILEGRAAGVFFHEIFGHRVEGHRQKNEDEGQTFAKKVGQPVMPAFISVYDDPTLTRIGGAELNGFYRFDDEAVPAARVVLIDHGVLRGFLLGRSPTRGFDRSNGHGRRQEGRAVVSRQGNLLVEPAQTVSLAELRRRLAAEARSQGKPYGLLFRDISGGFTNTQRGGPQAFKVLPILVYRVFVDGRPDELVRGADLVGTPLAALTKILAAADDFQTFNGYCGAESGFVPVSATSPSILVEQIEVERKDKGNEKPPLLPAPSIRLGGGGR